MKKVNVAALLSFNGGFLDTVGFLGLQGLFTAHVTGNFVTLGAALVFGTHGVVGKVLALPEFIFVTAFARLAGAALTARQKPTLRILLVAKVLFLAAFFVLGVAGLTFVRVLVRGESANGSCVTSIAGPHARCATVREMKEGPSRSTIRC